MNFLEIRQSSLCEPFDKGFFQCNYYNDLEEASLKESLFQNNNNVDLSFDFSQFQEFPKYENIAYIKNNQTNIPIKPTIPQTPNQSYNKNESIEIILNESEENKTKPSANLGRKRKNEEREASHTKYRSDNMMRKIKTYFMSFLHSYLNKSLSFSHKRFLKINKKINENLRKDFNMALMQMTVKEIFGQYAINGRYGDYKKERNINQAFICEIFKKNEEIETIKILNSKYIDLLIVLRTKFLNKFSSDLIEKEIKNGESKEDAEMYINELKDLLFNYEVWFEKKSGRCKIEK